jgi:bifunctional non-homologous end joining protein LigD
VVMTMARDARRGKVFVDWSQNDQHKTTVCAYSLRAGPRPMVSTPLSWDEVGAAVAAGDDSLLVFEAADVLERAGRLGDLYAPNLSVEQTFPAGA